MTTAEVMQRYGVTRQTVYSWRAKNAPIDDPEAMDRFIAQQRSRRLVSKTLSKADVDAPSFVPPAPAFPAPAPAINLIPLVPETEDRSTESELRPVPLEDLPESDLDRAKRLERIAARMAESGEAKTIDAWTKASAERRRIAEEARKNASAITDADSAFADATANILTVLVAHFEAVPHKAAFLAFGAADCGAEFEGKLAEMVDACFEDCLRELFFCIRGTGLEGIFGQLPPEIEAEEKAADLKRKELLASPPNRRQAESCSPGGEN